MPKTIPRYSPTPYTPRVALEEAYWLNYCGDKDRARKLLVHIIRHVIKEG